MRVSFDQILHVDFLLLKEGTSTAWLGGNALDESDLIPRKGDGEGEFASLGGFLPFIGEVVVSRRRSASEIEYVVCLCEGRGRGGEGERSISLRFPVRSTTQRLGAPCSLRVILSWMIARIGAMPVPGPTQITGAGLASSSLGSGSLSEPFRMPMRTVVGGVTLVVASLGEGGSVASQVVQRPRRGALSRVWYDTIATQRSSSIPGRLLFPAVAAVASGDGGGWGRLDRAYRLELAMEN